MTTAAVRNAAERSTKKARPLAVTAALTPDMESDLVGCVNEVCGDGVSVPPTMLSVKARDIAASINILDFHASW